MAAQNRQELLALFEKEYAKLEKTLDGVDARLAERPDPDDGISIKDTIAHRAHWIGLFLGWYADGKSGEPVETPAPGYKWNQLKEYNAKVREASRRQDWTGVRSDLQGGHRDLLDLIATLDDAELYGAHVYPWTKDWTVGRWAEAAGPSHYRSANKYVRKLIKTLSKETT